MRTGSGWLASPCEVAARGGDPSAGAGLHWTTPAGWSELPSSSLRQAHFRVGEDGTTECYLTLLAGDGGGLVPDVNLPAEISVGRPVGEAPLEEGYVIPRAGMVFEQFERDLVIQALQRTNGNRTRAAGLLGMKRDQIRYRIEKFGLRQSMPV